MPQDNSVTTHEVRITQTQSLTVSDLTDYVSGPECCVTLPAKSTDGTGWPTRVTETTPTIFAELLLYGSSVSSKELKDLCGNVMDAIKKYLCPLEQNVWYVTFKTP